MRPFRLLALLFPLAGALPATAQHDSALVAYFPFSGDASNQAGTARDGVPLGAVLGPDRFGEPDRAYAFDGGAAIYLGVSFAELDLPFSVSAWVYHDGPIGRIATVLSSNEAGSLYSGFWLQVHDTGELELSYGDGGGRSYTSRRTKMSAVPVETDRWIHVAAVVRGPSDMSLYVDGVDAGGSYSGTGGPLRTGTYPAFIGFGDEQVRENTWTGSLDELRVYDRDLSAGEVRALYEAEGGAVSAEEGVTEARGAELLVYPNPVDRSGVVQLDLRHAQHVRVELFDTIGRLVAVLHDGWVSAGQTPIPFEADRLVPGTYVVRAFNDEGLESDVITVR